jgi:hypothetical protein
VERSRLLIKDPPNDAWDGVYSFESKEGGDETSITGEAASLRDLGGGEPMLADRDTASSIADPSKAGLAPAVTPSDSRQAASETSPDSPPALAELLFQRGAITADQLAAASAAHQERGGRFCDLLLRLGVSDQELAACFNEEFRVPLIDVATAEPTPEALRLVPYELAQRHEILPIGVAGATLTVATSDPSNLDGREEVKLQSGCDLTVTVAPSGALREAIDYFYHERPREAG